MPRFYIQMHYMHMYLLIWSDISHHYNALPTRLVTNVTQVTLEPIIDNGRASILSPCAATPDDFLHAHRVYAENDLAPLQATLDRGWVNVENDVRFQAGPQLGLEKPKAVTSLTLSHRLRLFLCFFFLFPVFNLPSPR